MAHLVNAHPGFLQQVIGIAPAGELDNEEPVHLWTQAMDQSCGRGEITPLITGHQHFQIAVRLHGEKPLTQLSANSCNLGMEYYDGRRQKVTLRAP
jgi:hypothetical protein